VFTAYTLGSLICHDNPKDVFKFRYLRMLSYYILELLCTVEPGGDQYPVEFGKDTDRGLCVQQLVEHLLLIRPVAEEGTNQKSIFGENVGKLIRGDIQSCNDAVNQSQLVLAISLVRVLFYDSSHHPLSHFRCLEELLLTQQSQHFIDFLGSSRYVEKNSKQLLVVTKPL
jgi:hypothetical protein